MLANRDVRYAYGLILISCWLWLPQTTIGDGERILEVTATAYNSFLNQTDEDPIVTAWGEELKPGMKAIAVSRDLIEMGLKKGVQVKIEGLPGTYTVMDKMHKRWQRRIDIYMGHDLEAAEEWGRRRLTIRWYPLSPKRRDAGSPESSESTEPHREGRDPRPGLSTD